MVADRFAMSKRWHIDSIVAVLETAGNLTNEAVASDLVVLISQSKSLHSYSVHKLFTSVAGTEDKDAQLALIHVALWCIGEYGELLVTAAGAETASAGAEETYPVVSEEAVLALIERLSVGIVATVRTKEYILTACAKLCSRFTSTQTRLAALIAKYSSSVHLELQQRAVEYGVLATSQFKGIREQLLAPMPAAKKREKEEDKMEKMQEEQVSEEEESEEEEEEDREESEEDEKPKKKEKKKAAKAAVSSKPAADGMFDLEGMFGSTSVSTPAVTSSISMGGGDVDLLAGLFSDAPAASPSPSPPASNSFGGDLDDLFGSVAAPAAPPSEFPPAVVWQGNGITVTFHYSRVPLNPKMISVLAHFTATVAVSSFEFQVAVPKYLKLSMKTPSGKALPAHGAAVTQGIDIENSMQGDKKIMVRVKINFTIDGQALSQTAQIDNFPM
jgi:AP-1 complex subunit gamma-1